MISPSIYEFNILRISTVPSRKFANSCDWWGGSGCRLGDWLLQFDLNLKPKYCIDPTHPGI